MFLENVCDFEIDFVDLIILSMDMFVFAS